MLDRRAALAKTAGECIAARAMPASARPLAPPRLCEARSAAANQTDDRRAALVMNRGE